MNIYQKTWEIVHKRLEEKTSWGRVALMLMMFEALIEAGKEIDDKTDQG